MYSAGDIIIKTNDENNDRTEYEVEKYIGHGSHGLVYSVKNLQSNIR